MENIYQLAGGESLEIAVRVLQEKDLPEADRIMRLAFGTYLSLPEPATFLGDGDYVYSRWASDPSAAFCADVNGVLGGSIFVANWGSAGFFGPLTTHPSLWDKGVAKKLMAPAVACFEKWGTKMAGLFTFANSIKHVSLYQKFGFWPQYLTAIMSKPLSEATSNVTWSKCSDLNETECEQMIGTCRQLTDSVYEGLDVSMEIRSVYKQRLGDTLLCWDSGKLNGLAVCHFGPRTEAGRGACYIKFSAARSDKGKSFIALLNACEKMAAEKGLTRLVTGVNTARQEAYTEMLQYGFRSGNQGVMMTRGNEQGYNRPGIFITDDWR